MKAHHFIDCDVLLYSISGDPAEAAKRAQAIAVLDKDGGGVSIQVLQDFYVRATRAGQGNPLSHDNAMRLMKTWMRFAVQEMTLNIFTAALEIKTRHGLAYTDSTLLAAARALGCKTLYTERLNHGRAMDGVVVVNPFR